jgi:hypothetical protein
MMQTVYWHRDLPPLAGEILQEHVVEATSDRVSGSIVRFGDLWDQCQDERIESKRDDRTDESWLQGRFSYVLYRRA